MIDYILFPIFQMRHKGFSFYVLRFSDEGADPDLIIFASRSSWI